MRCAKCGGDNPEGVAYCAFCGAAVAARPAASGPPRSRGALRWVVLAAVLLCAVAAAGWAFVTDVHYRKAVADLDSTMRCGRHGDPDVLAETYRESREGRLRFIPTGRLIGNAAMASAAWTDPAPIHPPVWRRRAHRRLLAAVVRLQSVYVDALGQFQASPYGLRPAESAPEFEKAYRDYTDAVSAILGDGARVAGKEGGD